MSEDRPERRDPSELFEARHHPAEIVFGVASFLFALWLATRLGSQTKFVTGQPLTKQPGLWPGIAITGMVIFGALEVLFYWRRNTGIDRTALWPEMWLWARALEFFAWFMAYVLAVPAVGYLPATLILSATLAWRLGYRSGQMILAAMGAGAGTVIIFKSILQVKIPGGAVYEHLPNALRNFMILYL